MTRTVEATLAELRAATDKVLSRSFEAQSIEVGFSGVRSSRNPSSGALASDRACNAAYRLLAVRGRSRQELAVRLQRKGFATNTIASTLDRLCSLGLVDDEQFAREWIASRHRYSFRGRNALRHELRAKGVSFDIIDALLAEVNDEEERCRATELVERKLRACEPVDSLSPAERRRQAQRLSSMLARRGYDSNVSRVVLAPYL